MTRRTDVRCAACSREIDDSPSPEASPRRTRHPRDPRHPRHPRHPRYCDQCGAALMVPTTMKARLDGESAPVPLEAARRGGGWGRPLVLAGALVLLGGAVAALRDTQPRASGGELRAAMQDALDHGQGPGSDPICVANGLAYDGAVVHVQADNMVTLSWMNSLVAAGLYAAPREGESGGFDSQPIQTFQPEPELSRWAGPRRLCIARAMRLQAVANLGGVESMRWRGKAYPGVAADVEWRLQDPAPWLARPEVADAFAREMPTWRGARWQLRPDGWRLVQRKHFYFDGRRWATGEMLDRPEPAPSARNGTQL